MAIKDPLVLVFAFMNTAQLLGLSFISFFPTFGAHSIAAAFKLTTIQTYSNSRLFDYHQPTPCRVRWTVSKKKYLFFMTLPHRPPWVLASILCLANAWHFGLLKTSKETMFVI